MPGQWGEAPFVPICGAFVLGILAASAVHQCSFGLLALGGAALLAAASIAFAAHRDPLSLWLGFCAVSIGGALITIAGRDGYGGADVRALLRAGKIPLNKPLSFDGCITEERVRDATDIIVRLELRALRNGNVFEPRQGSVLLRVPVPEPEGQKDTTGLLRYGDRVRGWAQFSVRRNFQNPGAMERYEALARRGIHLVGRTKSALLLEVIPGDCTTWWQRAPAAVRHSVERRLAELVERGRRRDASILASTLLGDYSGLDSETREVFQNSGTFHVLVVSGLHVAWIAWALLQLLRFLRCPETASRLGVAGAILFYTSLVGFQASISRSFWMFAAYLGGRVFFRHGTPVNVAAASACLLLVAEPDWLFDAGFQLSFLCVAAICLLGAPFIEQVLRPILDPTSQMELQARQPIRTTASARLGRRLAATCQMVAENWGDACGEWVERAAQLLCRAAASAGLWIGGMLVVSLSVQIWIEPVLALHFNRLSWVAPLANLIVVPLSSAVLATGIAAALGSAIPLLAGPLLTLAAWTASLLFSATKAAAGFEAGWQRCPTIHPAGVTIAAILLFAWTFLHWRRQWFPCTFSALLLAFLAVGRAPSFLHPRDSSSRHAAAPIHPETALTLTFLDVGQGDSAVIRYPGGRVWVVDAGGMREMPNVVSQFDTGEVVVSRYLWQSWVTRLDRVLITHAHDDHAGGIPALLRNFRVAELECGGFDPALARSLNIARRRSTSVHLAHTGERRNLGGVQVETLWPPRTSGFPSPNESSVVLHLTYGKFTALLTGDMEKSTEVQIIEGPRPIRSALLKVAHHGSRYATLNPLLERVQPRWAVISAGRNNPFGNPSRELLMRLLRHGARPLATMDLGAVSFITDGHFFRIESYTSGTIETGVLETNRR